MEIPEIGDQCFRYDPEDIGCITDVHDSGEYFYVRWKNDDGDEDVEEFTFEEMGYWNSKDNRWEIG